MAQIIAENLRKSYRLIRRRPGIRGALVNLIKPEHRIVNAVDDISFSIKAGEIVGYLGPNGAGKSTTIKMLTGILHPDSGRVLIDGKCPYTDRMAVVQNLGAVFGQRTQLFWDLRLGESFELLRQIYRVPKSQYDQYMQWLDEHLDMGAYVDTPVRQLSLGQRMRGEVGASVIHGPKIIVLDEPTIGLDIEAKSGIRQLVRKINREFGTTVLLTSHDLDDVERLCSRLIIINGGKIIADDSVPSLMRLHTPFRKVIVDFAEEPDLLSIDPAMIVKKAGCRVELKINVNEEYVPSILTKITAMGQVRDVLINEPSIEDFLVALYAQRTISSERSVAAVDVIER